MNNQKGIAALPLIGIFLAIIVIGVGIGYFVATKVSSTTENENAVVNENSNVNTNAAASKNENANTNANADGNVNATEADAASTKGYGLFFPSDNGATTNNPRPTIIGQVAQSTTPLLATVFKNEDTPYGKDAPTLSFAPGETRNFHVSIDGVAITTVNGFARYPTLYCWEGALDVASVKKYATEDECLTKKKKTIPPLIYLVKPDSDLKDGKHTLKVSGTGVTSKTYTFTVDRSYTLPTQTVPAYNAAKPYDTFDGMTPCAPGYYYPTNTIPILLPKQSSANVVFSISFPQSADEKGSINRRGVQLSFSGVRYDLFFPSSTSLYGTALTDPDIGLFVPLDHLVYGDGKQATPWKILASEHYEIYDTYYELYPTDRSGQTYRGHAYPVSLSSSSWCDG